MVERPQPFTTKHISAHENPSSMYKLMCFKECIHSFLAKLQILDHLDYASSYLDALLLCSFITPLIGNLQGKANLGCLLVVNTSLNCV